jgi:hypothetical protein
MGVQSAECFLWVNTYVKGRLKPGKSQKMEHEKPLPKACAPDHIDGAFQSVLHDTGQIFGTDASIRLK